MPVNCKGRNSAETWSLEYIYIHVPCRSWAYLQCTSSASWKRCRLAGTDPRPKGSNPNDLHDVNATFRTISNAQGALRFEDSAWSDNVAEKWDMTVYSFTLSVEPQARSARFSPGNILEVLRSLTAGQPAEQEQRLSLLLLAFSMRIDTRSTEQVKDPFTTSQEL